MNIAIKYIKRVSVLMLVMAMISSCVQWEDPESTPMDPAPTVTLTLNAAGEASIMVDVTNSKDGYVSVLLYEGTGAELPSTYEEKAAYFGGNVSYFDFYSAEATANQAMTVTFSTGILQDATYEVMALAGNADGNISDAVILEVTTDDLHSPVLLDWDPGYDSDGVLEQGAPVTLFFDEPVVYDDSKDFMFSTYFTGMNEAAGSVSVDGDVVTVTPASDFPEGDIVFLSWDAGTVTDRVGNPVDTMESGVDGGYLVGVYTRMVRPPRAPLSVAPEVDSIASGASIVVTFDDAVGPDGAITRDMIILEYYEWDVDAEDYIFDHSATVDPATLVFDGATVTIPAIENHPAYDWIVELTIAEAAFDIGVFVPNAEITGSWWYY